MTQEKPLLLACGILKDEIETLISRGEIAAKVRFLNRDLHRDQTRLGRALDLALRERGKKGEPRPVVVYGDVCLGFQGEMMDMMKRHEVVKVEALNCIDALLGGQGKLLKLDPDHKMLFLTPAFIEFTRNLFSRSREEIRRLFSRLEGIILIDSLGNLADFENRIDEISDRTGLPVLETRSIGLLPLQQLLTRALRGTFFWHSRDKCCS